MARRQKAKAGVKVKICGITNWPDARNAIEAGADFLGFNFYRRSPRYIEPTKARAIVRRLPKGVTVVGVFVNEEEGAMLRAAREAGLDLLQLHGEESPAKVARAARRLPVIKALRVGKAFRSGDVKRFGKATAVLLDGFDAKRRGGTGTTFDWRRARRVGKNGARIFLAGGLTPENVADAIRIAQPYAIDVCSGVERAPGKKDKAKVRALMRAVNGGSQTRRGKR